jgi:hypothetical protein
MTTTYTAVRVEDEYNAEEWWDALREQFPEFARSLERNNAAVIASPLWDLLAGLPGFSGGPEYAPTALIDCGNEGDQWADVVGGKHRVFEVLQ